MSSMHYSAAWTECGCLISCWHEHKTVPEAAACIPCAGGYVVAVENGVMRSLTADEEAEFQRVHYAPPTNKMPLRARPEARAEAAVTDSHYAVMIKIRVGDRWSWGTWMCFETYAEAAAHAREGNKIVRFRSPEWLALRQHSEPASPNRYRDALRENVPPQGEGESFLDFVLRFLTAYGFDQEAEPDSDVKHGLINAEIIDLVLSRLSTLQRFLVVKLPRQTN